MAKSASKVSGELFLSSFLRIRTSGAAQTSRSCQRVEAIVFSVRDNGCLVMVPELQFKAPMWLQDRDGRLVVSPDDPAFSQHDEPPRCTTKCAPHRDSIAVECSELGLSQTLYLFQHITVDVSVPAEPPRYRHVPPLVQPVWSAMQVRARVFVCVQRPSRFGRARATSRSKGAIWSKRKPSALFVRWCRKSGRQSKTASRHGLSAARSACRCTGRSQTRGLKAAAVRQRAFRAPSTRPSTAARLQSGLARPPACWSGDFPDHAPAGSQCI